MSIKDFAFTRRGKGQVETVPMPEWGDGAVVYVHELSAADRDAYEAGQIDRDKNGVALVNFRGRMVCLTARDEKGDRIFSDEDLAAVGELPASDIQKLYAVASRLNKTTAADVKDAEKN